MRAIQSLSFLTTSRYHSAIVLPGLRSDQIHLTPTRARNAILRVRTLLSTRIWVNLRDTEFVTIESGTFLECIVFSATAEDYKKSGPFLPCETLVSIDATSPLCRDREDSTEPAFRGCPRAALLSKMAFRRWLVTAC